MPETTVLAWKTPDGGAGGPLSGRKGGGHRECAESKISQPRSDWATFGWRRYCCSRSAVWRSRARRLWLRAPRLATRPQRRARTRNRRRSPIRNLRSRFRHRHRRLRLRLRLLRRLRLRLRPLAKREPRSRRAQCRQLRDPPPPGPRRCGARRRRELWPLGCDRDRRFSGRSPRSRG
jgi:hypothetical protein